MSFGSLVGRDTSSFVTKYSRLMTNSIKTFIYRVNSVHRCSVHRLTCTVDIETHLIYILLFSCQTDYAVVM